MAMPGVETIMGSIWSIVPVRVCLEAEQSLEDLLRTVQDGITSATPYEPFGIQALQEHFGHKRYLQSVLLPQPPRPDSFSATVSAKEESGVKSSLRAAEELNNQTRLPFGLCIALTPKGDDLEVWARYDESFIDGGRVISIMNEFIQVLDSLLTSKIIGRGDTLPVLILGQDHGKTLPSVRFAPIWCNRQRLVQSRWKGSPTQMENLKRNTSWMEMPETKPRSRVYSAPSLKIRQRSSSQKEIKDRSRTRRSTKT